MAVTNCLHRRNSAGGFVGQHKRLCGLHNCDNDSIAHVMIGQHWCANICRKHLDYYGKRRDAQVTNELILDDEARLEPKHRKGSKVNANAN